MQQRQPTMVGYLAAGAALLAATTISAPHSAAQDSGQNSSQTIVMGNRYRQSADVLARYPDLNIKLNTPALSPDRTTYTSQAELESYLLALARPDAPVVIQTLTTTQQGRSLPLLVFTPERMTEPSAIRATGRPIVWLIGQQHGNEPAGSEALLAIANELADGRLRKLLDRITVVMVPRANPDGAAADTRDTAAKMDLNRDHASLVLPETRALHAAVQNYLPDLVVDAHEFSVAQRWIEKFGGLQAVDLMILEATHPMVPADVKAMSRNLFTPAIEAAASALGLTSLPYHTTSTRKIDRAVSMGGNAPGIARNAFGLMGAVSLLLETRGVGIGMESFQRRVATHVVAIEAVLETAAANAAHLKQTVTAARAAIAIEPARVILSATPQSETISLPLVDPQSGVQRTIDVVMANSRQVQQVTQRDRPVAYIVLPEAKTVAGELRLFGVGVCLVADAIDIDAEMFEISERSTADRRAINPDAAVKSTLRAARVHVPAGSLYVPMQQQMAHRAAAALEPDAPGSFVALDVVRVATDRMTAPIVRLPKAAAVRLTPDNTTAATAALCAPPG
jgi:hypothetical protein